MSLRDDWIHGSFCLLHRHVIDLIQRGDADYAYLMVRALCEHVRRYDLR
jgi:hypothetical protein